MTEQLTLAPTDLLDLFFAKVDVGDCWQWTGATDRGYGKFYARYKTVRAHRWLYEQLVGPVAGDLMLDHLCRNRACVNPDHLEPVPQRLNIIRGAGPSLARRRARIRKEGVSGRADLTGEAGTGAAVRPLLGAASPAVKPPPTAPAEAAAPPRKKRDAGLPPVVRRAS